jgi:hypothetical protein
LPIQTTYRLNLDAEQLDAIIGAVEGVEIEYGFSVGEHGRYHPVAENILASKRGDELREELRRVRNA